MPKAKESKRFSLNKADLVKFVKDAFVFAIPAIIVGLEAYQRGEDPVIAIKVWAGGMAINLLKKYIKGK